MKKSRLKFTVHHKGEERVSKEFDFDDGYYRFEVDKLKGGDSIKLSLASDGSRFTAKYVHGEDEGHFASSATKSASREFVIPSDKNVRKIQLNIESAPGSEGSNPPSTLSDDPPTRYPTLILETKIADDNCDDDCED